VIYLVLAAQFESFVALFIIQLTVPLAATGAPLRHDPAGRAPPPGMTNSPTALTRLRQSRVGAASSSRQTRLI
jgi:hypothetical protein